MAYEDNGKLQVDQDKHSRCGPDSTNVGEQTSKKMFQLEWKICTYPEPELLHLMKYQSILTLGSLHFTASRMETITRAASSDVWCLMSKSDPVAGINNNY